MKKIDTEKHSLERHRGCPACGHQSLAEEIEGLLGRYRPLFTKPSFEHFTAFMRCFMGSDQKKCVTTVFWESLSEKHFSTFYRFLSQYHWSLKELCQTTLRFLIETFALSKSVSADGKSWLIAIMDETRTKKWGTKIFGTSWHFNHAKTMTVEVFGKSLKIKLVSKLVVSRALKRPVFLVMVQFPGAKVGYLVTTALGLAAHEVVIHYCRRWKIEITFRGLNQRFGAKDYMVRNKNSVPRFMNLCLLAYTLVELLSLGMIPISKDLFHAVCDRPWYHRSAPSIGQMRTLIQLLASRATGIFNAKRNSRLEAKNPEAFYRRLAAQRQFPYFSEALAESLN